MKSIPIPTCFSYNPGESGTCTHSTQRTKPSSAPPPPNGVQGKADRILYTYLLCWSCVVRGGEQDPDCSRTQSWEKRGVGSHLSSGQGHVQKSGFRGGVWISTSLQAALGKKVRSLFGTGCHKSMQLMI